MYIHLIGSHPRLAACLRFEQSSRCAVAKGGAGGINRLASF